MISPLISMTTKDEGIGGKNPGKNCFYPYERDTTRGTPNLDAAPSMHSETPRSRMHPATCSMCGASFGFYEEGTEKPEYCPDHKWLAGFFGVESSNIEGFSHDGKLNLYVKFKTGQIYTYWPLGLSILEVIKEVQQRGDSVGKWFHANVKTNEHVKFQKVEIKPLEESSFPAHKQTDYTVSNVDATQPQRGILSGKGVVNLVDDNPQNKRGVK